MVQFFRNADPRPNGYIPYFRESSTVIGYDGGENRHCCRYCAVVMAVMHFGSTIWFQLVIQLNKFEKEIPSFVSTLRPSPSLNQCLQEMSPIMATTSQVILVTFTQESPKN